MTENYFSTHNAVRFTGNHMSTDCAKLINDLVYAMTGLDGCYKYDFIEDRTEFTIYPESGDFADNKSENDDVRAAYNQAHVEVLDRYPEVFKY